MKIGTEIKFERGHDIVESSFVVVHRVGLPFLLPNDRERFHEEAKQLSNRKVEEGVLKHVFEHINEQIGEKRSPSYMGFCIYKTPLIEQGKPILVMHPADMVEYLRNHLICTSTPKAKVET